MLLVHHGSTPLLVARQGHQVRRPAFLTHSRANLGLVSRSITTASASFTDSKDSRQALRTAIVDQLTGPHFDTWLDKKRFVPDRLVIQSRRLWYYATLLTPGAVSALFTEEQLSMLRTAAVDAFADIQHFRRVFL
jgi:hypothetical protein